MRPPLVHAGGVYTAYANGLHLPGRYLAPSYPIAPPELEQEAHGILAAAMPGLEVVAVRIDAVAEGGGALHCITVGLSLGDPTKDGIAP